MADTPFTKEAAKTAADNACALFSAIEHNARHDLLDHLATLLEFLEAAHTAAPNEAHP